MVKPTPLDFAPVTPASTPPPDAIEIAIGRVWLDDEGIVRTILYDVPGFGLKEAQEHIEAYAKITGGRKRPILADIRRLTMTADRAARQYYASEAGSRYNLAVALLVYSDVTRLLANFFFRFHKPGFPSRMFSNEVEAVDWLRGFLE